MVLLGPPTFNDTGSLGNSLRWVAYHLLCSLGTASGFPVGNRDVELEPTAFSSFLLFHVFPVTSIFLCSSLLLPVIFCSLPSIF